MTLAGSNHSLAVETAFLGACIGFVVLLLAVVLYLSHKWYLTPPTTAATLFGGVCVPICESSDSSAVQNLGKACPFSDIETSSDSEEDALRRLNSLNRLPLETLTIQADDGLPSISDVGTVNNNNCTDNHINDQQQCIVEVSSPNVIVNDIENEPPIINENGAMATHDTIASFSAISSEEIASIEVAFLYDAPMREMTVHVLQGRNYPTGMGGSQVRLLLLPSKKQRRKTRIRQGPSPQYMESFLLPRVNPEDVNAMGIRVRVYLWSGRMRRERLLGEARISFDRINLRLETTLWLTLQLPPASSIQDWGTTPSLTRSDSTGSQQSVQSYALSITPPYGSSMKGGSIAEILIGLTYNGTTGCLSVEIIKGSHFRGGRGNDTKPPDTYVKLVLVDSNGHEMGRAKTGLRRAQPNPLYKDTFIFQVALFQLGDVTLYLSVYNRRRTAMGKKGRQMIGWLCLGESSSGSEELQHWNDMRAARQPTQIQRWHSLLRP
ncbi:PREDICTED: synaptotagmin-14 [Ceratosolen solmsi marchali]|uniref:Synaptotagmin-14 n=1 Tax=Ceratosolen solmsi marchali TaxID=326594 RepID=A0AAJ7E2N0_9HYME|nr:PREDICTED: synaptotagmin-14 [Ceratosolen solmsi marchali]